MSADRGQAFNQRTITVELSDDEAEPTSSTQTSGRPQKRRRVGALDKECDALITAEDFLRPFYQQMCRGTDEFAEIKRRAHLAQSKRQFDDDRAGLQGEAQQLRSENQRLREENQRLSTKSRANLETIRKAVDSAQRAAACPLCYTIHRDVTVTSCGHSFGKDCLEEWMLHRDDCPMCRATIEYDVDLRATRGARPLIFPMFDAIEELEQLMDRFARDDGPAGRVSPEL